MTPTVVLIHGMWHGAWAWSAVTEELALRGIPAVAVDLEGHGTRQRSPRSRWRRPFDPDEYATEPSPSADITASSCAAALVRQLRRIGRGSPCLLVAHSMGGVIAAAVAEQAPELVVGLVHVATLIPLRGAAAEYISLPEHADSLVPSQLVADPQVVGALRLDPADPARRAGLRETFYGDVDAEQADAATALLGVDGPLGIVGETLVLTPERFGSHPQTYIVCERDRVIPPALQRVIADDLGGLARAPIRCRSIDTSHTPLLSAPGLVADVVADAVEQTPTRTLESPGSAVRAAGRRSATAGGAQPADEGDDLAR